LGVEQRGQALGTGVGPRRGHPRPATGRPAPIPPGAAPCRSPRQPRSRRARFMPWSSAATLAILVSFARGIDQRSVDVRSDGGIERDRPAGGDGAICPPA
jgi:hypothetical protein